MKSLKYLIVTMSIFIASCGGSNLGFNNDELTGLDLPAGANAILSVWTRTSPSTPLALSIDTGSQTINLDVALMGLKNIKLETLEMTDEEAAEFELVGPFVVDLVGETVENCGTSNIDDDADDDGIDDSHDLDDDNDGIPDSEDPDDDNDGIPDSDDNSMDEIKIFDALTLPAGTYETIKARIDDIKIEECPDLAGSPILNNAVYLEGTVDGVPFTFSEEFDTDLELDNEMGIEVDNTSIASFILTFDMSAWFDGVDFSSATKTDGVIVIDSENNQELQDLIKQNIEDNAELENDHDSDGIPDSDDDS